MKLEYGSEEEHLSTLKRAKENKISYIWSGDLRRNAYLRENVNYGIGKGIIQVTPVDVDEQESGFEVKWL